MNAVEHLVELLPRRALLSLAAAAGVDEPAESSTEALRRQVAGRFSLDLVGFLNLAERRVLDYLAAHERLDSAGSVGEVRARLWRWAAEHEAGGAAWLGSAVQPVLATLAGRLVLFGAVRGLCPPATALPRPIPPPVSCAPPEDEPDCLEDLLAAADALVGVRLGPAGRDKGAFGARVARLLGLCEHGYAEPDWRGQVEVKTVPVVRDRAHAWRVKEDPAVGMTSVPPLTKLRRVLWIARVADHGESSPVLGWYYQELDDRLTELVLAHLHTRPKGAARTCRRGWYLHKRFFAGSGFLRVLNG